MYKRNRAPRISLGSLLITFVLGAVVGGAAVYGIIAPSSTPPSTPPSVADAPPPPAPTPEPVVETPEEVPEEVPEALPESISPPEPTPEPAPTEEVAEALRGARFLFISTRGTALSNESREFLNEFQPGGVILLGHNIENRSQTISYVEAIKEAAGMGTSRADLPLIAVDQEGGTVNRLRLRHAPSAADMGASADTNFVAETAARFAEACRARGIAVNFAPVMDIRTPGGPRDFEERTFSDDAGLVTVHGLAFANALMDGGVIPVAKHYPGHGAASGDTHDGPATLAHPVDELAHIMYPFAEAVARGIPGIMAGHITALALDADAPATLSNRLLRQVLRERWGYDGVIVADDLAMRAIQDGYTLEEAAVRALQAGCDALIITETDFATLRRVATAIERAIEQGILDEAAMRQSQARLEEWQQWLRSPAAAIDTPEAIKEEEGIIDDISETVEETIETPSEELPQVEPPVSVEPEDEPEPEPEPDPEDVPEPEEPAEEAEMDSAEVDEPADDAPGDESPETEDGDDDPTDEASEDAPSTEGLIAIEHEVQQGEWLSRIAVRYGVTTRELVEWNNLPSDDVRFGTRLTVYLPPERAAEFTDEPLPEPEDDTQEPPADDEEPSPGDNAPRATPADDSDGPAAPPAGTRTIQHDVLPGETLTRLAQRYRVGTSDIIAWNDLDNTNIRIGQVLTIHVPEDFVESED